MDADKEALVGVVSKRLCKRANKNKENYCMIKKNRYNRKDYICKNCRRKQSRKFSSEKKKQKKGD